LRKLPEGEKFRFRCHKELPCFNKCCSDVNIFLTPYDVLRMRRTLWIPSSEFLKRYTVTLLGEEGLPYVLIRMMDNDNKTCPFLGQEGCMIYQDRPWSCRMYPLFPAGEDGQTYMVEEKPSCLGTKEDRQWTVEEWKESQGVKKYDEMNVLYSEITSHEFFSKGNKLDEKKSKLLYRACYDLDEFRTFLFAWKFLDMFEMEEDAIKELEQDDEKLLLFGFKWIRFNLFNEDVLNIKPDKKFEALRAIRGK